LSAVQRGAGAFLAYASAAPARMTGIMNFACFQGESSIMRIP